MHVALATQPESMLGLFRRSVKLYVTSLPKVFLFSLVLSIVVFIPRIYVLIFGYELNLSTITTHWQSLWMLLIEFLVLFIFTSMLWRTRCVLYQEHESLLADMKIAIMKLPLIIVAAIIQAFVLSLIMLMTIGLSVYLAPNATTNLTGGSLSHGLFIAIALAINVWFSVYVYYTLIFYLPLILTEDKGIFTAIKKSIYLVWGNWWRTFIFLLIPWIFYLILLIALRNIFHIDLHLYFIELVKPFSWVTLSIHIFIFAIFIPWVAAALLIQLRDLELRKK